MEEIQKKGKDVGSWLKVFCPEVRCLSEEEILNLPEDDRKKAEAGGKKGVWLEVFCPDQACIIDESRIAVRIGGVAEKEKRGFWLNLFCPEDRCLANEPTDLP
jgi:hypothetical protein